MAANLLNATATCPHYLMFSKLGCDIEFKQLIEYENKI